MRPCYGCDNPKDDRRWMSIDGKSLCEVCIDKKFENTICPNCRHANQELDKLRKENERLRENLRHIQIYIGSVESKISENIEEALNPPSPGEKEE